MAIKTSVVVDWIEADEETIRVDFSSANSAGPELFMTLYAEKSMESYEALAALNKNQRLDITLT